MSHKSRSIYSRNFFTQLTSKSWIIVSVSVLIVILAPLASLANEVKPFAFDIPAYIEIKGALTIERVASALLILILIASFLQTAIDIWMLNFYRGSIEKKERFTSLLSLLAGIMISLIGIRGLEPFIVIRDDIQGYLFRVIDILLTGTIISGGTATVHKISTSLTESLDATKVKNKVAKAEAEEALKILRP